MPRRGRIGSERRASLNSCHSKTKRIADHRHGAQAHGGRGDDGTQEKSESGIQHTGCHGYPDDVVNERQHEILADIAHGGATQGPAARDAGEIAFDEREAGTLHGDIGARAHRNADIGFGQRGSIIDAIPGHRDHTAFAFEAPNDGVLLIGQYVRFHLSDAELGGDSLGRRAIVAGQHDDPDALTAQGIERRHRRRLDRIGHRDDAGRLIIDRHEEGRGAFFSQRVGARFEIGAGARHGP